MRKFPKVADVVDDSEKTRIEALQALRTVLENAARASADTVELEYGGDNRLEVCYMFGDTGAGGTLITRELECKVIQIIVEKARLKNRCCGTMEMRAKEVSSPGSAGSIDVNLTVPSGKLCCLQYLAQLDIFELLSTIM